MSVVDRKREPLRDRRGDIGSRLRLQLSGDVFGGVLGIFLIAAKVDQHEVVGYISGVAVVVVLDERAHALAHIEDHDDRAAGHVPCLSLASLESG